MLWFLGIIGFVIILWPLIIQLLALIGNIILTVVGVPMIWIFRLFCRPTTQAEEDKMFEDFAKIATLLLCLAILGLIIWWGIRTT